MINVQQELIAYEGSDWEEFLNAKDIMDIFKTILNLSPDKTIRGGIVKYIVWTYSRTSDKIMLDMEWRRNKNFIFDETFLPKEYHAMTVELKSEAVLIAIQNWMNYQDEDIAMQILALKDLKMEMQSSSVGSIRKANNEIDYDQKFKNANYVIELSETIKKLEAQLIQNDTRLKTAAKEVKITKAQSTFGPEKFSR